MSRAPHFGCGWKRGWLLGTLMLIGCGAFAEVPIPRLASPVTDLTGTLTPNQIASLDQSLRAFEVRLALPEPRV